MADIYAYATHGVVPSTSSAIAFVHARARSSMVSMTTNAQRIAVHPYRLNRGAFLPKYPLITLLARFYGVISRTEDSDWGVLASPDFALWDAKDASSVWLTVPESAYGQLLGPGGDIVLEPNMHGDRTSTRTYTAAKMPAGWYFGGLVQRPDVAWGIVALRVLGDDLNGPLITIDVGATQVSVTAVAGRYEMRVGDTMFAFHNRSSNDTQATVIGLGVDNDTVFVHIRDGETTDVYEWTTQFELLCNQLTIGGPDSPECLLYAAAHGIDKEMARVMSSMVGYLSC